MAPDYYERREFAVMMIPWSRSTYSIATTCPSCSGPHIHTVAMHPQFNRQVFYQWHVMICLVVTDISENFPHKYLCVTFSRLIVKLLPHKIIYDYSTYIWLFCWFPTHAANTLLWRSYSSKKQETDEEFDARWEAYFNREDIDAWELRKGVNDLYGHDLVPEPKIVVAMLRAARRINDVAMAVRILEAASLELLLCRNSCRANRIADNHTTSCNYTISGYLARA